MDRSEKKKEFECALVFRTYTFCRSLLITGLCHTSNEAAQHTLFIRTRPSEHLMVPPFFEKVISAREALKQSHSDATVKKVSNICEASGYLWC